jgi:hypothetical protein
MHKNDINALEIHISNSALLFCRSLKQISIDSLTLPNLYLRIKQILLIIYCVIGINQNDLIIMLLHLIFPIHPKESTEKEYNTWIY